MMKMFCPHEPLHIVSQLDALQQNACKIYSISLIICCFCLTISVEEASMEGKWQFLPPEQDRAPAGTQHALCVPHAKSCWWI